MMYKREDFEIGKWYKVKLGSRPYYMKVKSDIDTERCSGEFYYTDQDRCINDHHRFSYSDIQGLTSYKRKPLKIRKPKHKLRVITHCTHCHYISRKTLETDGVSLPYITKMVSKCCATHKIDVTPYERVLA